MLDLSQKFKFWANFKETFEKKFCLVLYRPCSKRHFMSGERNQGCRRKFSKFKLKITCNILNSENEITWDNLKFCSKDVLYILSSFTSWCVKPGSLTACRRCGVNTHVGQVTCRKKYHASINLCVGARASTSGNFRNRAKVSESARWLLQDL